MLLASVASFTTLFRHALIALGNDSEKQPLGRREAVQALAARLQFDLSGVEQVLEVRERKSKAKRLDVRDVCARYLAGIEKVAAAVDQALDSDASGRG